VAAEIDRLVVKIVGDATSYLSALRRASDETARAADRIANQSNVVARFFSTIVNQARGAADALSALGSGNWLRENLSFFGQMESAMMRLTAAIEANGQAADLVMKDYNAFTDSLVKQTTVTRIAAAQMFQYAEGVGVTGDAAMRAAKNTIALMALRPELSMMRALRMTTALEHGRTGPIERAFPMLGSIKDSSQRVTEAQAQLTKAWGAAEAQANSFAGQMTRLGNDLWWLANQYGNVIAEGAKPFLEWVREGITWLNSMDKTTKSWIATIGVIITATTTLGAAFTFLAPLVMLAFNPFTVLLGVALTGIALWVQKVGGLAKAFEIVKEKLEQFWEWTLPIRKALSGVFSAVWDLVKIAMDRISEYVQYVWNDVLGMSQTDWGKVRDTIVEALIFAEYLLRNFDKTAAFVWAAVKVYAVMAFDTIMYYIKDVLPYSLNWLADNWEEIWRMMTDYAQKVFYGVVRAATAFFNSDLWVQVFSPIKQAFGRVALSVLVSTGKLAFDMAKSISTPRETQKSIYKWWDDFNQANDEASNAPVKNLEDAKNTVASILRDMMNPAPLNGTPYKFTKFEPPPQMTSLLAARLQQEYNEKYNTLLQGDKESWPEFLKRRLKELQESGELINEAEKTGLKIGEGMNKGLAKEVKKFDNVLYGSAAHLRRIAEYTAQLYGQSARESVVGKSDKYKHSDSGGGVDWMDPKFATPKVDSGGTDWGSAQTSRSLSEFFDWAMTTREDTSRNMADTPTTVAAPDSVKTSLRNVSAGKITGILDEMVNEKSDLSFEAQYLTELIKSTRAEDVGALLEEWQKSADQKTPSGERRRRMLENIFNKTRQEGRKIQVMGDTDERPDSPGNRYGGDDRDPFVSSTTYHMPVGGTGYSGTPWWNPYQMSVPGTRGSYGGQSPHDTVAISEQKRVTDAMADREAVQALLEATRMLIDLLRPKTGGKVTTLELED
jgi:hypothetical protein